MLQRTFSAPTRPSTQPMQHPVIPPLQQKPTHAKLIHQKTSRATCFKHPPLQDCRPPRSYSVPFNIILTSKGMSEPHTLDLSISWKIKQRLTFYGLTQHQSSSTHQTAVESQTSRSNYEVSANSVNCKSSIQSSDLTTSVPQRI